ncbi:MAG: hypothetical protein ACI9DS_001880 [Glaciecola sp.]|jgi:hypothetical protein
MINPECSNIQATGFTPPDIEKPTRIMYFNIDRDLNGGGSRN